VVPILVGILGMVALATRPVGYPALAVTALVGLSALAIPSHRPATASGAAWVGAVIVGVGAFVVAGRMGTSPPVPFTPLAAAAGVVAAVAEEALFRRVLYGQLVRLGAIAAVVGTAVAFAAIHLPMYGPAVLPLDFAAGLVLGWQRWTTGGWSAPAVTHAAANLVPFV
jgi:membrane protease YdiL (CAAX protease family)